MTYAIALMALGAGIIIGIFWSRLGERARLAATTRYAYNMGREAGKRKQKEK